ncbi:TAXI family TRAP transporter solute-binding subunit [Hoeflea sp. CAU 1731]
MKRLPAPKIERRLELNFQGDWGHANLHRICGWISSVMTPLCGDGTRIATWTGKWGSEAPKVVADGLVDMAMSVPAAWVASALTGHGIYSGKPVKGISAIATMPQTDWVLLAIDQSFGVRTFDDLREKRPPLRIATGPDDGDHTVGYGVQRVMEAAGIDRATLESWGGCYLEEDRPDRVLNLLKDPGADAVFFEAVMTPFWRKAAEERAFHYIPIERDVLDAVERDFGLTRATMPAGRLHGMDYPVETLDFADFLMIVRDDMPDDIAYMLAWIICETSEILERQYSHLPVEHSPVTYPLEPARMMKTSIPLHPGAERYYREAGYLDGGF